MNSATIWLKRADGLARVCAPRMLVATALNRARELAQATPDAAFIVTDGRRELAQYGPWGSYRIFPMRRG